MTTPPALRGNYWLDFPGSYRTEEITELLRWISIGECGMVVGGSGTGKSNLLGFLGSRPEIVAARMNAGSERVHCLHFDVNNLPTVTTLYFYRGLIETLLQHGESFGAHIAQSLTDLASGVNWDDLFAVYMLLQRLHRCVLNSGNVKIAWLLDRFDEACIKLDVQTLSSLRSLRDQFKGKLCLIAAARKPLDQLRDASEIDEFYEIMAANICRVGVMVERDARWITGQMADRLETEFSEADVQQMIRVTGGLPAFLRAATIARSEDAIQSEQSEKEWIEHLLTRTEIQRNCSEIWNDLERADQDGLKAVVLGGSATAAIADAAQCLADMALIKEGKRGEWELFSPIFADYVRDKSGGTVGIIYDKLSGTVYKDGIDLEIKLTAKESFLLEHFLLHTNKICPKDELITVGYPEVEDIGAVSDEALAARISSLRRKLDVDCIEAVKGRGYCFKQPAD